MQSAYHNDKPSGLTSSIFPNFTGGTMEIHDRLFHAVGKISCINLLNEGDVENEVLHIEYEKFGMKTSEEWKKTDPISFDLNTYIATFEKFFDKDELVCIYFESYLAGERGWICPKNVCMVFPDKEIFQISKILN